jgi:hypothetical protein
MAYDNRRGRPSSSVCSLTSAWTSRGRRAKPHRFAVSPTRALAAAVLGLGIAACDPPISGSDSGTVGASPGDVGARTDDVGARTDDVGASPDAGTVVDARALDGGDTGRGSLVTGVHEVLFVGNSYVFTGDVPGRYRGLLSPSRVESVVAGGYRLTQHAMDADADGTPLAMWLRTGPLEARSFDVVILQEQSQIGGFPEGQPDRIASLEGASRLASLATDNGSSVVLYVTWGRERGDDTNPELFPDFSAMQDRLDAGYRAMAARLRDEGARVRLAPVGPAFRVVHDELVARGADPTAEGSDFDVLYAADGSHPSERGAYLIALVLASSLTGADPRVFPDASDLDAATSSRYREVAAQVIGDPAWQSELR